MIDFPLDKSLLADAMRLLPPVSLAVRVRGRVLHLELWPIAEDDARQWWPSPAERARARRVVIRSGDVTLYQSGEPGIVGDENVLEILVLQAWAVQAMSWIDHGAYRLRRTPHGDVYIERRPDHCDRGRFLAKIFPAHGAKCTACQVDDADMFPRYYFDVERAKAEMNAWIDARGWDHAK